MGLFDKIEVNPATLRKASSQCSATAEKITKQMEIVLDVMESLSTQDWYGTDRTLVDSQFKNFIDRDLSKCVPKLELLQESLNKAATIWEQRAREAEDAAKSMLG